MPSRHNTLRSTPGNGVSRRGLHRVSVIESGVPPLFELVWGADFQVRWPGNTEEICATPGGAARFGGSDTPVRLSAEDRIKANNIYDHWGQSISKYERSNRLSPFTSKFDAFLKWKYTLTPDEKAGYDLFNGKANCNSCHLDGRSTT
jgi:cytochrome c peroxidase